MLCTNEFNILDTNFDRSVKHYIAWRRSLGQDPNVRNTEGKNALDIARELNAQSIVDLLEP